jgi:hypothetical protein
VRAATPSAAPPTTCDWNLRETARAKLRVYVKRVLRKHGYPPGKQEQATATVLKQAELVSDEAAAADSVFGYLERTAEPAADGVRWPTVDPRGPADAGDAPFYDASFYCGVAGVGLFLADYHRLTGSPRARDLAREAADSLAAHARPDRGGLNWPRFADEAVATSCQWWHGAPGVGLFYAKAYEVLGDRTHLETAEAAAERTFAYGDVRGNPSQCHGLAGNAELFVELHRLTGAPRWRERAHDFARRALAYRTAWPDGDTWQGNEPGSASPAFMDGAAGAGHFFLRLLDPVGVAMPLLLGPGPRAPTGRWRPR